MGKGSQSWGLVAMWVPGGNGAWYFTDSSAPSTRERTSNPANLQAALTEPVPSFIFSPSPSPSIERALMPARV